MLILALSFIISMIIIIYLSKYDLGTAIFVGAVILALMNGVNIIMVGQSVFGDVANLFLALTVTFIPILGGLMQDSGLMPELINNLKVPRKISLMLTPALFGLLPIAGGALMSAPMVGKLGEDLEPGRKVAINVWYRHALIIFYPLSPAMIVLTAIAGLPLYPTVGASIILAGIMIAVGYITLLGKVKNTEIRGRRNLNIVLRNSIPLFFAPAMDLIGRFILDVPVPAVFMFAGACGSVIIALLMSRIKSDPALKRMELKDIRRISRDMDIWKFPLLLYAMFFFLKVFISTEIPDAVSMLNLPFVGFMLIAFLLGVFTGRVQLPMSILIPIYLGQYNLTAFPLWDYIWLYFAEFMGYLVLFTHPCVAYSIKYFKTDYRSSLKYLLPPIMICLSAALIIHPLGKLLGF